MSWQHVPFAVAALFALPSLIHSYAGIWRCWKARS